MARKPRNHFPGAFYHVIDLGNRGQEIVSEVSQRGCGALQPGSCGHKQGDKGTEEEDS